MFKRINFVFLLIVFVSSLCYSNQNGPYIKISGVVKDKSTKEVIDNASVIIYGTTQGETTNMLGEFTLNVKYGDIISVSFLGYKTKTLFVDKDIPSKVVFELENEDYALNEVVIKPKRERYKRKNNPAVEFAENIIARKKHMFVVNLTCKAFSPAPDVLTNGRAYLAVSTRIPKRKTIMV